MKRLVSILGILASIATLCMFVRPAMADPAFYSTSFVQSVSSAVASATTYKADVHTAPLQHFAIQVTGSTGTPSGWDVRLEGSLDGVTYKNLISHQVSDGSGTIKFSTQTSLGTFSPINFFQAYVSSLTLNSSSSKITVTILGTQ